MFEAINIEWNNTDSSSCKKLPANVGKAIPCSYFIYSIYATLNFLTSDL